MTTLAYTLATKQSTTLAYTLQLQKHSVNAKAHHLKNRYLLKWALIRNQPHKIIQKPALC